MKKALTLTLTLAIIFTLSLLVACGGGSGSAPDTDNTAATQNEEANQGAEETIGMLNPPAWLIGEWVTTEGANPSSEDVVVTAHNVIVSSGKLDFSWQINTAKLNVTETESGDVYRLEYTASDMDFSYTFTRLDDGSMTMTVLDSVTFRYEKS
ncbi:MAG: hypothetical protein FWD27_07685 [Coriobacteriia bacterium]|nr:hypothetical protein [Coriobacteriia bacterium]